MCVFFPRRSKLCKSRFLALNPLFSNKILKNTFDNEQFSVVFFKWRTLLFGVCVRFHFFYFSFMRTMTLPKYKKIVEISFKSYVDNWAENWKIKYKKKDNKKHLSKNGTMTVNVNRATIKSNLHMIPNHHQLPKEWINTDFFPLFLVYFCFWLKFNPLKFFTTIKKAK